MTIVIICYLISLIKRWLIKYMVTNKILTIKIISIIRMDILIFFREIKSKALVVKILLIKKYYIIILYRINKVRLII